MARKAKRIRKAIIQRAGDRVSAEVVLFSKSGSSMFETGAVLTANSHAPIPRAVEAVDRILSYPVLGGLHHHYVRSDLRQAQGSTEARRDQCPEWRLAPSSEWKRFPWQRMRFSVHTGRGSGLHHSDPRNRTRLGQFMEFETLCTFACGIDRPRRQSASLLLCPPE